jgi:hypothetical protein
MVLKSISRGPAHALCGGFGESCRDDSLSANATGSESQRECWPVCVGRNWASNSPQLQPLALSHSSLVFLQSLSPTLLSILVRKVLDFVARLGKSQKMVLATSSGTGLGATGTCGAV